MREVVANRLRSIDHTLVVAGESVYFLRYGAANISSTRSFYVADRRETEPVRVPRAEFILRRLTNPVVLKPLKNGRITIQIRNDHNLAVVIHTDQLYSRRNFLTRRRVLVAICFG